MQVRLLLLVLVLCSVVFVCAASRGRSSFRSFRSSRSFRSRVFRSTSYRSFRTSRYNMPKGVLRRKGGIGINKNMLLAAGSVYIAYKLRPRFHIGGGYRYNIDDYAICEGKVTGWNDNNQTTSYKYFLCPTDINHIIRFDNRKYCCGSAPRQFCCDKQAFYREHGMVVTGTSVAVIAIASVLSILFVCGCCGLLLYCKLRNRMSGQPQPAPVPTDDTAGKTSYPLQSLQTPPAYPPAASDAGYSPHPPATSDAGYSPYPPATSDAGYSPYPPPLPAGASSDPPPYPTYQPPGGAAPPNLPPPAYPGPA